VPIANCGISEATLMAMNERPGALSIGEAADEPVFVFAAQRSGSTLLARLLNCHPDLVIWGEHGGFINKLTDADLIMQSCSDVLARRSAAELDDFFRFEGSCQTAFMPWINPFTCSDFADHCRQLIRSMMVRGVGAGQRWGFKEIRYHRPMVAAFLEKLFPHGQFILLLRDPIELCISNILVDWSLEHLRARGVEDRREFLRVVDDCLYAIVAIQEGLMQCARDLPGKSIITRYEALAGSPLSEMTRVLGFLALPLTAPVLDKMRIVAGAVSGATDKAAAEHNALLNEHQIRIVAQELLCGVTENIRAEGIDTARLMGLGDKGKYSFLTGELLESHPFISSMF
jgi:Sulfotransferase family